MTSLRERIESVGYQPPVEDFESAGPCDLCGPRPGAHPVELARRDRYGFAVRFSLCAGCGLGRLDPRPSRDAYAAFYASVYRPLVSAFHGRTIDATTVQDDQAGYAEELAGWLAGHGVAPRTVLDVGGSTGVVGLAVAQTLQGAAECSPADVTVLDPSPDELAVAASLGMRTIAGFAEDLGADAGPWDLVLLCQTLDHLLDARGTLAALRRATGAFAFVDALDVAWVLERAGAIEGAVKIDHPYSFTRATALAALRQAGFEVVAERFSDDGHAGFLLAPGEVVEPDQAALRRDADLFVARVVELRARGHRSMTPTSATDNTFAR